MSSRSESRCERHDRLESVVNKQPTPSSIALTPTNANNGFDRILNVRVSIMNRMQGQ